MRPRRLFLRRGNGRLWAVFVFGLVGSLGARTARAIVPAFSGTEARAWVDRQCALGPRVPGTSAHAAWIHLVTARLDSLHIQVRTEEFSHPSPMGPGSLALTNLIASIRPELRPRLLIGAHLDSRPWADQDPDPKAHGTPIQGANDGASGCAVLLTLAKILTEHPPPIGVDLAFFDGEDLGRSEHPEEFCLGSEWMAEHWVEARPDWVIVLDMVGSERMEIGRELYSDSEAPELLGLVFGIAKSKGYREWNPDVQYGVVDDHLSFARLGVPSIDLIGFGDPVWHTLGDVPSRISSRSLGRVGDVLVTLIFGGYLTP